MDFKEEDLNYADVAKKEDAESAELEKDTKVLEALEADLVAAQAALDSAEARHKQVLRAIAKEMSNGEEKVKAPRKMSGEVKELKEEDVVDKAVEPKASEPVSHGGKNTSARTPKEVSRDKWEARHSREIRVREATKKYKEKMRRGARDAKYAQAEVDNADASTPKGGDTPAAPKLEAPAEEDGTAIENGAKSISERMKGLKSLPDAADQRSALLKIMTANRENYFTSDPTEVVLDLEERKLVDPALASEMMALLNDVAPVKGPSLSPDQWLEHARKVAEMKRPDEKAFTQNEVAYLKSIDEKTVKEAEAELAAAEQNLAELVKLSESWYPVVDSPSTKPAAPPASVEVEVDLDSAAKVEEQLEEKKKAEPKGSKNTSALPPKVVSKEKWMAQRGLEARNREKTVKARQARRAECLDRKMEAAEVA